MADSRQKMYKMSLEHVVVQKSRKLFRTIEVMSNGRRTQCEGAPSLLVLGMAPSTLQIFTHP